MAHIPEVTQYKPILAKHRSRVDADGQPLYETFSQQAWNALPPLMYREADGAMVKHPKQGWVKIDPKGLKEPAEAAELDRPKKPKGEIKEPATGATTGEA